VRGPSTSSHGRCTGARQSPVQHSSPKNVWSATSELARVHRLFLPQGKPRLPRMSVALNDEMATDVCRVLVYRLQPIQHNSSAVPIAMAACALHIKDAHNAPLFFTDPIN
jgi:hypothetical protein